MHDRSAIPLLASTLLLLAGCGGGDLPETEVARLRDLAADLGARNEWAEARKTLEALVAREDAALEDLLRAANAELAFVEGSDPVERARPLLERARRLAPEDPLLLWCDYNVASLAYELESAVTVLRQLDAQRPQDFLVTLALAQVLDELDDPALEPEAEALYRRVLGLRSETTGAWRATTLYRLSQQLNRQDRAREAEPLFAELNALTARGIEAPKDPFHSLGTLGVIPPHSPGALERPAPAAFTTRFAREDLEQTGLRGVLALTLQVEPLETLGTRQEELYRTMLAPTLVGFGPRGVELLAGPGAPARLSERSTLAVEPFDRMNHGADRQADALADKKRGDRELDLLVLLEEGNETALHLLENVGGSWTLHPEPLASFAASLGAHSLLAVDFDHEGDVDLLVATQAGLRLLRNDGLDGSGGLTDATETAGFPGGPWRPRSEDLDGDNDVDFLLAGAAGTVALASNERGGLFVDASATLPAGLSGRWIVPGDFDGDGRVDLAAFADELVLHLQHPGGGWSHAPLRFPLPEPPTGEPQLVDLDLDGANDLFWPVARRAAAGRLAPGFPGGGVGVALGEPFAEPHAGAATLDMADLDGDFDLDLVRCDEQEALVLRAEGRGNGLGLALLGHKDNARGIGALLELRSGSLYRRLYTRGRPELLGLGEAPIEMVRITWPSGIHQGNWKLAPRQAVAVAQRPGQINSCPFLYTWNGTTYEFVSDVLGITPLGLPMAPGMLVPPDHDEYVLVKGEQFVPKDGFYELHLTEELREVTYLDRIRLDVVDHPADVEVFPNERFSFPPFPAAHTHTVRAPLAPLTAVDQDGRSWTRELARDDRILAIPFEKENGPYRGLASAHTLELSFDLERVRGAAGLRLFLNGWFYWTDASVNLAAARHPDLEFVPPLLSVPDGNGGWRECGPIGFPAGKLKTMVADVDALLNRNDPRLRLHSTLRIYWDSIRLATDADDAPLVTTSLEPASARLWQRGFSRPRALLGAHDCEWFEWDEVESEPVWNQHPGFYTRLGETLPLVGAIDDCFVIMGAGDALTVRFDARGLPPLPDGWRRDYLVFLDGWAKDRDPNTLAALYVEPLPFHGMSGYPYGKDEKYPDDEFHRAYRRDWNSRPATRWIEPLAPAAAGRSKTTSEIPSKSATPAATTGSVMCSPSTNTPAAPATSG